MGTQMQQRRGTAAQWAAANPILADGEIGYEEDTHVFKMGDGVTHWLSLAMPYMANSLFDAKGDLIVGSADNTPSKLSRGATGQRLTVNADGSLGWVNMPDLSVYETLTHAATTYETLSDVLATYETKAHALATYAPKHLYVAKTADTTKISNVTPANDPHLVLAVAASSVYLIDALLFISGDPAADFIAEFNGPAGSIFDWTGEGPDTSIASVTGNADGKWAAKIANGPIGGAISYGTFSTGTIQAVRLRGRATIGVTAGNLAVMWCQNVSTAVNTTLYSGSFLELNKVA